MKNISVIGAGTMGNGIAHVSAQSNYLKERRSPSSAVTVLPTAKAVVRFLYPGQRAFNSDGF